MEMLGLILISYVGLASSVVIYNRPPPPVYYDIQPNGYYSTPVVPKTHAVVPQVYEDRYYSGAGIRDYGGDLLRKDVHRVQESGLESAKGAGGKDLVRVDTLGGDGYLGTSAARDTAIYGGARSGGLEGYGKAGNGAYQTYGNGGFKKGHSSTGFHKAYSNVESGKDSSFVDHEIKEGGEKFDGALDGFHGSALHGDWTQGTKNGEAEHANQAHELAASRLRSEGERLSKFGTDGRQGKYDRQHMLATNRDEGRHWTGRTADTQHTPFYYF